MTTLRATLQDEREITALIHAYGACLDRKDWEGWGAVFASDVVAEYAMWGGEDLGGREGRDRLVPWMRDSMAPWPVTHHLMTNVVVEVAPDGDPDRARSTSYVLATHVTPGAAEHFQAGGWYALEHVRTGDGWRIARLRLEIVWTAGGSPNVAEG